MDFSSLWNRELFVFSFRALVTEQSSANFHHLHVSEGLCSQQCSQDDTFLKLHIMQSSWYQHGIYQG